jgi:flagellar biosynthesis protein FlhG
MADQAEKLRAMKPMAVSADADSWRLPMVAVTGGRAGVGTSTVAINLAAALADLGERVLVVDASEHRNDLLGVAGIRQTAANSLPDVVRGNCGLIDAVVCGPLGTQLITGNPRRVAAEFNRHHEQQFLAALNAVTSHFDAIVIDTGHGLSPWTRRIWRRSRLTVVATTADQSALLDTYAMLKLGVDDAIQSRVGVVVNQADDDSIADDVQRRLSDSCQRFLSLNLAALPSLPNAETDDFGTPTRPRVWEHSDSRFGHAVLWLGRAVSDLIGMEDAGCRGQGNDDSVQPRSRSRHPACL